MREIPEDVNPLQLIGALHDVVHEEGPHHRVPKSKIREARLRALGYDEGELQRKIKELTDAVRIPQSVGQGQAVPVSTEIPDGSVPPSTTG